MQVNVVFFATHTECGFVYTRKNNNIVFIKNSSQICFGQSLLSGIISTSRFFSSTLQENNLIWMFFF